MSLNMKKEIRKEIAELKRAILKNTDDKGRAYGDSISLGKAALKEFKKQKALIERERIRVTRGCDRQISKVAKRILVLQGRLS
jgi:peptidoglycan hydrolase CwlO-like protein